MAADFQHIVIGGGGVGLSTAYHLASRGCSVLLLEQFELGHNRGSSHGESRIIRYSYDDELYVPMVAAAYRLWHQIQQESGEQLVIETGGLDLGWPGNEEFDRCIRSLEIHSIPHEVLDSRELQHRFPQFHVSEAVRGLWQPSTGMLVPDRCIAALSRLATGHGATLKSSSRVERIEPEADAVIVHTEEDSFSCERLVACPGAWAQPMLSTLGLNVPLKVTVEQYAFFEPAEPESHSLGQLPIFMSYTAGPLPLFYGFPATDELGVKVAEHHGGNVTTAEDRSMEVDQQRLLRLQERVSELLPGLSDKITRAATCLYTATCDKHFIIDRLPGSDNIIVGAGFSGHGFKFVSLAGKILSDLAVDGTTPFPNAPFDIDRLVKAQVG